MEVRTCDHDGAWTPSSTKFESSRDCGAPKVAYGTRIVNGTRVRAHSDWPWNAALFKYKGKDRRQDPNYICGATLISSNALLTAAHCVTYHGTPYAEVAEAFQVVLLPYSSEHRRNSGKNGTNSQALTLSSIHVHENYDPRTFEADIAVLKLARNVRLSTHVYPICVPASGQQNELIERAQTTVGRIGTVLGFGMDSSSKISPTLKMTRLPIVSPRECQAVSNLFPSTSQFCAGSKGTTVCNGDSGGGLLFQEQDEPRLYYIQGIVSHGEHDEDRTSCDPSKYTIFTRVGAFKAWMEEIFISGD